MSVMEQDYTYDSEFLRRTSRTLPGGPDTTVTYEYTDGEADSPCDAATDVPQAGRQTRSISATSGAPGDAVTYATFYDDHGRPQGATSGTLDDVNAGATGWTCSTYDDRGRPTSVDHPAFDGTPARTVTSDHAVGGNPLVRSVSDPAGTITTRVDLLGRVVSSTDVWGVTTTTAYDDAGPRGVRHRDQAVGVVEARLGEQEPWGATLIEVAECDSALVSFLVDEVGVSPSSRDRFGTGLVHVVTYPYRSEQSGCEPDETTATLRVLLERGAAPCVAPVDRPDQVPALRAEEWGLLPDESVELLREHAQEC